MGRTTFINNVVGVSFNCWDKTNNAGNVVWELNDGTQVGLLFNGTNKNLRLVKYEVSGNETNLFTVNGS